MSGLVPGQHVTTKLLLPCSQPARCWNTIFLWRRRRKLSIFQYQSTVESISCSLPIQPTLYCDEGIHAHVYLAMVWNYVRECELELKGAEHYG